MTTNQLTAATKRPIAGSGHDRPACERLAEQASVVANDIQGMGAIAKDVACQKLEEIQENASAVIEQGRARVRGSTRTLERFIAEQPLTSVLIAGGLGMFLGRFWMRK